MNASELSVVLDRFSVAQTVIELEECASALLKGKLVNKARDDQRFRTGLATCFQIVEPDADRLKAVAIAYRLGESSKPVMRMVKPLAAPALSRELPTLELLPNGDDRYYASLSVMDADATWVSQFAASGIAREETAETARGALAIRLFADLTLADALNLLAANLSQIKFTTEKPAESAAKRLRRVIAAVRRAIVAKAIPTGRDIGIALRKLFDSPFVNAADQVEGKVSRELASECCGLVHDILRTQLTIVADPEVYRSLLAAKNWITPALWPRFVKGDDNISNVRQALEDAILLLAKQRVTDQSLLDALVIFFSTREEAAARTAQIARENEGLDNDVREWLMRFGRARSTPVLSSMTEARDSSSDAAVASLLVLADALQSMLVNAAEIKGQNGSTLPIQISRSVTRLTSEIVRLAAARQLSIRLQPGDVVEYSQHSHELVGGRQMGIRSVRVVQPLVERRGADGVVAVIQKAIVESLEDVKHG
jgi:hypothetical protein